MLNILKSELFKLTRNKALKVVLILAVCFAIFGTLLMTFVSFYAKEIIGDQLLNSKNALLLAMSSDGQSLLIMISAVITSIIVTDHRRGILRNMLVSGYCRTRVYLAKLIISALVGIVLCFISTTIYSLAGTIFFGGGGINLGRFLIQFLLLLILFCAFSSIATFIAFLTKSTGATIGISIALLFLFTIISAAATIVNGLNLNEFLGKSLQFVGELYVGNLLAPAVTPDEKTTKLIQYLVTAIVTITATTSLGILTFNKSDIK